MFFSSRTIRNVPTQMKFHTHTGYYYLSHTCKWAYITFYYQVSIYTGDEVQFGDTIYHSKRFHSRNTAKAENYSWGSTGEKKVVGVV